VLEGDNTPHKAKTNAIQTKNRLLTHQCMNHKTTTDTQGLKQTKIAAKKNFLRHENTTKTRKLAA
jgi:hypothetical protein